MAKSSFRIAILNSSSFGLVFPEHLEVLRDIGTVEIIKVPAEIDPDELAQRLQGVHAVIASITPQFTAQTLSQLPSLMLIVRHGTGVNNVDVKTALDLGIAVTKVTGDVSQAAVAEHAVALMGAASRQLLAAERAVRDGRYGDRANFVGREIKNKRVGIIGLGNIGSHVSKILSLGFGARVLAYDPFVPDRAFEVCGAEKAPLEELFAKSEFITLHCTLTEQSRSIINERGLSLMRAGVIVVNTARGELVDEDAMLQAIDKGVVRYYATDVVTGEPVAKDHKLLRSRRVLVVPHLGGYTYDSLKRMGESVMLNVQEALIDRRVPDNAVLPEMQSHPMRLRDPR